MGSPAGAAATVFPEMGALLVPYLVKDYALGLRDAERTHRRQARTRRSRTSTSSRCCATSTTASAISGPPRSRSSSRSDLRGTKIRVQQAKVFGDTINGLGGNAVPMALGRGRHGGQAGRDRRRRPADRQHQGAEDLRGVEIRLDDLSQLRPDQRGDEPGHLEWAVGRATEADHGRGRARRRRRSARRPSRSTTSPRPSRSSSRSA